MPERGPGVKSLMLPVTSTSGTCGKSGFKDTLVLSVPHRLYAAAYHG
jgi:hypothetical protein